MCIVVVCIQVYIGSVTPDISAAASLDCWHGPCLWPLVLDSVLLPASVPVFPGSPLGLACPVLVSSATFSVPLQGANSNTQPRHSSLSPLDEDGDHPQKLLVKWPCLGVSTKVFKKMR